MRIWWWKKIRQQNGVESLNYVSRQESLREFKSWSGFGEELEILDDNPLPAVVMVKPTSEFNVSEKRDELRTNLNKIKGVQEVRLDNDWMEKINRTFLVNRPCGNFLYCINGDSGILGYW